MKSIMASKQSFTLTVSTLPYDFWIKLSCVCCLIEILRLYSLFIWSISGRVDVFGPYSFLHKLQMIATTCSVSSYFLYIYSQTAEVVFPLPLPLLPKEMLSSVDGSVVLPLPSETDGSVLSSGTTLSSKSSMSTSSSISSPYKKLGYVFYTFCICFVYVFKKSTVFIRNWSIFRINYTFLIICFLYVFKNLIKNVELKTYNLYGILTNSL